MPPDYRFTTTLLALLRGLAAYGRWRAAATLGLMMAGAALEGVGLAMLVPLLALLGGKAGGPAQALVGRVLDRLGVHGQIGALALLLGIFVLLVVARALVLARRDRMLAELQLGFVERQRSGLLATLAQARWSDIADLRHARVLHAVDDNVERTAAAVQLVGQLFTACAMLFAQWLLVAMIAPVMAAAAAALIVVGMAALLPLTRNASRLGASVAGGRLRLFDGAAQLLGGLKLAMAQNVQHAFVAEFEETARAVTRQRLDLLARFSRSRIAATTAGALGGAVLVLAGVWSGTPLVALVVTLAVFTRMIGPVTGMQQVAQQITGHLPGFAALSALRTELGAETGPVGPAPPMPRRVPVRFDTVGYLHGAERTAGVRDVSVVIRPGEIVGIVGPSGAGKTTFVDLLTGLLEPQSGTVRIGAVALDATSARQWRERISYVGQDSYLFNDTIRRNLALGAGPVEEERLWRALDGVGAGDLVRGLPAGLDTMVAERGMRLSGGQRQRIALARALLRGPDMLILDEATNAIDVGGEAAIFAELVRLVPRPALVVVAHRTETLAWCPRLLRFRDGRLVADEDAGMSGPATLAP